MNKPSDNMLLSATQLESMYKEQQAEIYNEEQNRILAEQASIEREREAYAEQQRLYVEEYMTSGAERSERLAKIKEALVSECIYKLYCESIAFPMTSRDKVIGRNLVNKFVIENGAGNLISSFATENMILSEFSRISQKYYDRVLEEGCDNKEACELVGHISDQIIHQDIVDDFYKELENIDVKDASKAIKDRVADAISDFVDTNAANKIEYEEIIRTAQDKVAAINGADEALGESYLDIARREINEMKNSREMNVFGYMVEALTTSVFKDEALRTRFVNEGTVDMDGIVNSAQLIYTMLEMVNTTNMVNVDEEFINWYLTNL
jgi:hypothetical protein